SNAAAGLAAADRVSLQAAGRAREEMEEPPADSNWVDHERVRRRRITGRERGVPETGRLPGRSPALARLRDQRQRQPDVDGEEQPRGVRRPARLAGPESRAAGVNVRSGRLQPAGDVRLKADA